MFSVDRPGRDIFQTIPDKNRRKGSNAPLGRQKGIISCLTFNSVYSTVFCSGTYGDTTIALYDESSPPSQQLLQILYHSKGGADRPGVSQVRVWCGVCGGGVRACAGAAALLRACAYLLVQVMFSRCGQYIFAGYRKESKIVCWDIRGSPGIPVFTLSRQNTTLTNQRMQFDLDNSGKFLVTGTQNGHVLIYDVAATNSENATQTTDYTAIAAPVEDGSRLVSSWQAHYGKLSFYSLLFLIIILVQICFNSIILLTLSCSCRLCQ